MFYLNHVGMTAFHKAGLVALAASLEILRDKRKLPEGVSFDYLDEQCLVLRGVEKSAECLHQLLTMIYAIKNDLIDFPLMQGWRESRRAKLQQLLFQSFLQHPQSRDAGKEIREAQEDIDGKKIDYRYSPLYDFKHRSMSTCKKWEEDLKKKTRIELAGWAYPGAMKRHEKVSTSALSDDPELYPLLLCAPLGCLYFDGAAYSGTGGRDPKTEMFLVLPRFTNLEKSVRKLRRYYQPQNSTRMGRSLVAVGETDAALMAAIYLELDVIGNNLDTHLSVFRFGTVSWSKQQKTRTGVYHSLFISTHTLERYERVLHCMPDQRKSNPAGEYYTVVFPARGQIADNLVGEKPWYYGFYKYMRDQRHKKIGYWYKELNAMISDTRLWTDEKRRLFVLLVQDGIRKRYGKVYDQAVRLNADIKAAFQREYEKIRLAFSHCRTREQLRKELMDFLSKTRAKLSELDPIEEMDLMMLVFNDTRDWQEIRDLCLVALAGYRGSGEEHLSEDQLEAKN